MDQNERAEAYRRIHGRSPATPSPGPYRWPVEVVHDNGTTEVAYAVDTTLDDRGVLLTGDDGRYFRPRPHGETGHVEVDPP